MTDEGLALAVLALGELTAVRTNDLAVELYQAWVHLRERLATTREPDHRDPLPVRGTLRQCIQVGNLPS